jgi:ATP-dependent RNA helicase RhlE
VTHFSDFGLAEPLQKALAAEGYTTPTPIQTQAIPVAMTGSDIVGLAQTGTGKTAAFALPILHQLQRDPHHAGPKSCRVLVLAPTRELAAQIAQAFKAYGRFLGFSTAVIFGGVPLGKQREVLSRGVDILVATPGRLLDHVDNRALRLDRVEMFVLDEADHMMDMGFIHSLKRIAKLLPPQRQSLFFSATMPKEIEELADQFLTDPHKVAVTPVSSTAERVEQGVIHVENPRKSDLLHALLQERPDINRAIVFTRTKHGADKVVRRLEEQGHAADAIHGNKSQNQRERALAAFKKGQVRLLVATEIAARGIDVDDVSHVINYDLPNVPEQYVHRIGRTARAGAGGQAISFCAPDERAWLRDIEKLTKQAVPVIEHALAAPTPGPNDPVPKPPPIGGRGQQQRGQPQRGQQQRRHEPRRDEQRGEGRARDGDRRDGDFRERDLRERDGRDGRGRGAERPRSAPNAASEGRARDERRGAPPRAQEASRPDQRGQDHRGQDHRGGPKRGQDQRPANRRDDRRSDGRSESRSESRGDQRAQGKPANKARNGKTYAARGDAVWTNKE